MPALVLRPLPAVHGRTDREPDSSAFADTYHALSVSYCSVAALVPALDTVVYQSILAIRLTAAAGHMAEIVFAFVLVSGTAAVHTDTLLRSEHCTGN